MQILNLWVWAGPGIMHLGQVLIHGSYLNSRNVQPVMVENGVSRLWRWECWSGLMSDLLSHCSPVLSRRVKRISPSWRWKNCIAQESTRIIGSKVMVADVSMQLGFLISVEIMDLGVWRPGGGAQSSETCWTKLPLQAVGREGQAMLLQISQQMFPHESLP